MFNTFNVFIPFISSSSVPGVFLYIICNLSIVSLTSTNAKDVNAFALGIYGANGELPIIWLIVSINISSS